MPLPHTCTAHPGLLTKQSVLGKNNCQHNRVFLAPHSTQCVCTVVAYSARAHRASAPDQQQHRIHTPLTRTVPAAALHAQTAHLHCASHMAVPYDTDTTIPKHSCAYHAYLLKIDKIIINHVIIRVHMGLHYTCGSQHESQASKIGFMRLPQAWSQLGNLYLSFNDSQPQGAWEDSHKLFNPLRGYMALVCSTVAINCPFGTVDFLH